MTWEILETKMIKVNHGTRRMAVVRCDCGRVSTVRYDHVVSGRTTECKSCSAKHHSAKFLPPPKYKGIKGFSKTHFNVFKRGANVRNIEFNITQQDAWDQWILQDGKCALTGLDLILEAKLSNQTVDYSIITASLDRIDSNKGYSIGNIQWVHKEINRLKNNLDQEHFIYLCKLVAKYKG